MAHAAIGAGAGSRSGATRPGATRSGATRSGATRARAGAIGRLALAAAAAGVCAPWGGAAWGGAAWAQDGDPAGVVSTARPDPAAPPPAPLTPEQAQARRTLILARQVYALIGDQTLESEVRTMTTAMEVQVARALTDKDRTRARALVAAVSESVDDIRPQVGAAAVGAMARDFTEGELTDMLAFYRSASGQAALHRLPAITHRSMAAALAALPDLMTSVESDFCAKVRCSTQDHQAFAAAAVRLAAVLPHGRPPAAVPATPPAS